MKTRAALAVLSLAALAACAPHQMHRKHMAMMHGPSPAMGQTYEGIVEDTAGKSIGRVNMAQGPRGVMIRLDLQAGSLTPGWHGTHLHEIGTCADPAAGFKASGAHVGHGETVSHGFLNPQGPESGDLPNIYAPASGPIAAEFYVEGVTLSDGVARGPHSRHQMKKPMPLLDADGAALVIHANPDDHRTQPIGGAGARVACAAIRR
jgi:superoxide dismutase, Cu-Zn family